MGIFSHLASDDDESHVKEKEETAGGLISKKDIVSAIETLEHLACPSEFEFIKGYIDRFYSDDARDLARNLNRIQAMALDRIFI